MFNFKEEKVQWNELLGKGSFGRVYPYGKNKDEKSWVVKVITVSDDQQLIDTIQEIVFGFSCDHPGIVPIKGYFIEKLKGGEYKVYLKLPRMVETLRQKIERESTLKESYSEEQIIIYFYSLLCSLEYLHKKNIAHRDIRPANIMLSQEGELKLCDVGIARLVTEEESAYTEQKRVGSLGYTAPEVMDTNHHLKKKDLFKADAWSLGLVIVELCLRKKEIYNFREKFVEKREKELMEKVKGLKGKESEKLLSLIFGLLDFNPEKRKSIEDTKRFIEDNLNFRQVSCESKSLKEDTEVQERFLQIKKNLKEILRRNVKFEESGECEITNLKGNQIHIVISLVKELELKQLEIKSHTEFLNKEVRILAEHIVKNLTSLHTLVLDFSNCNQISDAGIMSLGEHIGKNLTSLQDLGLYFLK